jgi:hypothetical protein
MIHTEYVSRNLAPRAEAWREGRRPDGQLKVTCSWPVGATGPGPLMSWCAERVFGTHRS